MKKLFVALMIVAACAALVYVSLLMYIANKAQEDTKVRSDAILVLGGSVMSGTSCVGPICKEIGFVPAAHYNPCLLARVRHAVVLYQQGYASKILMSGGTDDDGVNEADSMKQLAVAAGVPAEAVLTENKSTSTYENFAFSKPVLAEAGLRSVIIVTDPYHNARAELVAKKLQYAYSLSPDVESTCWDQDKNKPFTNRDSRREALAIIAYKLLNEI
jgi:uncharacterized SAM-binding protein YcdF (DUF218 family)